MPFLKGSMKKEYFKISFGGMNYTEEFLIDVMAYFEDMPLNEEIVVEKIEMTEEEFNKLKVL